MSIAGIWREKAPSHTGVSAIPDTTRYGSMHNGHSDAEAASLVRQLFSSPSSLGRKKIFFISSDNGSACYELCERIGWALVSVYGGPVDLVVEPQRDHVPQSQAAIAAGMIARRTNSPQDLCHLSPEEFHRGLTGTAGHPPQSPFARYVIFGANVDDSFAPIFANLCDGAVLVVQAHQTRREAAFRAKQLVAHWNARLLGAVLNNRTFPVPESIYRWL